LRHSVKSLLKTACSHMMPPLQHVCNGFVHPAMWTSPHRHEKLGYNLKTKIADMTWNNSMVMEQFIR